MRTYHIVMLVIGLMQFAFSNVTSAQENNQLFDYTKTVWIINVIDGSGTVYGRPRPDDYNPRQGFISIYEVLTKYVYNLQDIHSLNEPASLTVTHELILINGVAEQRLFIGDHWISDERKMALMDEIDYRNLTEWLGAREKNKDYKENPPIDKMVRQFREYISPDIESFNDYFKHNQVSSAAINSRSSLDNTITLLPKQSNSSDPLSSSSSSAAPKAISSLAANKNKIEVSSTMVNQLSVEHSLKQIAKSTANKNEHAASNQEVTVSSRWLIAIGLLIGMFLIRCLIRKNNN